MERKRIALHARKIVQNVLRIRCFFYEGLKIPWTFTDAYFHPRFFCVHLFTRYVYPTRFYFYPCEYFKRRKETFRWSIPRYRLRIAPPTFTKITQTFSLPPPTTIEADPCACVFLPRLGRLFIYRCFYSVNCLEKENICLVLNNALEKRTTLDAGFTFFLFLF